MKISKREKRALYNAGAGFFTVMLAMSAAGYQDAGIMAAAFFGALAQGGLSYCREMSEAYKTDGPGKLRTIAGLATVF